MRNRTLSQIDETYFALCRENILGALAANPNGPTAAEIFGVIRGGKAGKNSMMRAILAELLDEEVIENGVDRLRTKTYYLAGKSPRHGGIVVPVCAVPPIAMVSRGTWFSALGVAA